METEGAVGSLRRQVLGVARHGPDCSIMLWYRHARRMTLSKKHRKTLADVFAKPTRPNVKWSRVKSLVVALGGTVEERAGSSVALNLNGALAVIHSPHPSPDMSRPSVRSVADFLSSAGVEADAGSNPQNR